MKNSNYNLVKMMLSKLDDVWRVEKHYAKDAKSSSCQRCQRILDAILKDDEQHAKALREELAKHIKEKTFD